MKRTPNSIIISYCKRGIPMQQCFRETEFNISTVRFAYYNYWKKLRENPVKTEVIDGKTHLTIQSKINFE